jgi:hypothetical protein
MSANLSHEMLHLSCLNSEMYTEAGCVPWQRVQNSFVDVCYLSGLPKETPKFFLNASKLFKRGD